MKSTVVKIFGSDYYVKADGDGGHVLEIAGIVDEKMKEIDRQFHQPSSTRTAVLACMNLVDEYIHKGRQDTRWLSDRIGSLIEKLDAVV
jgi:cell division protein ZapA (FtsZ GTPase activity inhibitor)